MVGFGGAIIVKQLVIKITGAVNSSNLDEWKEELIALIQSTNTELITDDDFFAATKQVKAFKSAENALKLAKQSAIDQAEEIQILFSAIDEISEEARQARLSLEHQIKARKLEIKNEFIQSGLDEVQKTIDHNFDALEYLDSSNFLNLSRFESALKGKQGLQSIKLAINSLCNQINQELSDQIEKAKSNKAMLDALPHEYKPLFQDLASLLNLTPSELKHLIDKRIDVYKEEISRKNVESTTNDLTNIKDSKIAPKAQAPFEPKSVQKGNYNIIINIISTKEDAIKVAQSIREKYRNNPSVKNIKLLKSSAPDVSVDEMDITMRAKSGLKQSGIEKVSQLVNYTENQIIELPNIGKKTAKDIEFGLQDMGFNFRSTDEILIQNNKKLSASSKDLSKEVPLEEAKISAREVEENKSNSGKIFKSIPMNVKNQVIGINSFLSKVFKKETKISSFLVDLEFSADDIKSLRGNVPEIALKINQAIYEYLQKYKDKRLYQIVNDRYGLDGEGAKTLNQIGINQNISRERVRQIESKTLMRCRHKAFKEYLQGILLQEINFILRTDPKP